MIAKLEFDLNEHYEKMAHIRAIKADSAYNALYKIQEYVRKYRDPEEYLDMDNLISDIDNIIEDEGIDLDLEWT